ncbi:MAG: glycoside hydrolase family 127 protein [Calditrichaeota bacterium]|nr:glycoside hydrolase family 127 protein [Calditrichota bacterium]
MPALGESFSAPRARVPWRAPRGKGLRPPLLTPLPASAVRPLGWLRAQLRIQADGLTGHLDEFWPDVAHSKWFGGDAEGWERAPYWLDGLIPLAWLLDDAALKEKATTRIEQILAGQREDGWYGPYVPPEQGASKQYDIWAFFLMNKVLVQYHELTGDGRALQAVLRCLKAMDKHLRRYPLFNWGKFRWFENLIAIYYAYRHTGEAWLLDLARLHHEQGFDYPSFYRQEDVTVPTPRRGLWKWTKHVVNTAMAVKSGALWWQLSGEPADRRFPAEMIALLDRYHGQVNGMFSGDECLAGKNPLQGTELCAVVEMMYSLEHLLSIFGEPAFADRLERIAFNALPATFSPDMWAHQYDQQVNQVQCTINEEHLWTTNGPESNIYGLEPNFGCCTANMHQGWPKFAAHLWMRTPDQGLAAVAYAPSAVSVQIKGTPVRVTLETDYPFRQQLSFIVESQEPVRFPLWLRIPAWADGAKVDAPKRASSPLPPGSFVKIEREWRGTTRLTLELPMRPRVERRYNDAVAIVRGPLVYSLLIGEEWRQVNQDKPHRQPPHADWEVRPTTPWNYALRVDAASPDRSLSFEERPVGSPPFSPQGAGVVAKAKGSLLPNWKLQHGWAGETPPSPVHSDQPLQEVTLIPYGCTNIRITEFPQLAE